MISALGQNYFVHIPLDKKPGRDTGTCTFDWFYVKVKGQYVFLKMSIEVFYTLSNFTPLALKKEIKSNLNWNWRRHIDLTRIGLVLHQTYVSFRTIVCFSFPRRPVKIIANPWKVSMNVIHSLTWQILCLFLLPKKQNALIFELVVFVEYNLSASGWNGDMSW